MEFCIRRKERNQITFLSLNISIDLDEDGSTPYVFIIDKNRSLRGRNDDEDVVTLYGYDARSVAQINKKMIDDVKVILAEYRLALKIYNNEKGKVDEKYKVYWTNPRYYNFWNHFYS